MFNIPVLIGSVLISVLVVFAIILAILYRKVVSTNMVHIVQRGRTTMPYGTGLEGGNVYYRWPSWIPKFGVTVIELPVSNFDLSLERLRSLRRRPRSLHGGRHGVLPHR